MLLQSSTEPSVALHATCTVISHLSAGSTKVGASEGFTLGECDGGSEETVGLCVGLSDAIEGKGDRTRDGTNDGTLEGRELGTSDGKRLGISEGIAVLGERLGISEGIAVLGSRLTTAGAAVADAFVGLRVGEAGFIVRAVGTGVRVVTGLAFVGGRVARVGPAAGVAGPLFTRVGYRVRVDGFFVGLKVAGAMLELGGSAGEALGGGDRLPSSISC